MFAFIWVGVALLIFPAVAWAMSRVLGDTRPISRTHWTRTDRIMDQFITGFFTLMAALSWPFYPVFAAFFGLTFASGHVVKKLAAK